MTNRTLIGLAGALVVLAALALFGQWERQPLERGAALIVPGLQEQLDQVSRMELVGAGEEAIATLERGAAGWSVVERDGYPADLQKIRHTLLSLAEARILEAKTANPDWHDRLGVEAIENESAGGVAVTLIGPDAPVSVIVGDAVGDYQAYVRRADEDQSYLIDRDPEVSSATTDWLEPGILTIPGERIQRVTVTHLDGEVLTILKDDPGQTNFAVEAIPADRELQYDSVANVMGNVLANLSLQDVEADTDDQEPVTVTEFRTFDGLLITAESIEREDEAWVSFGVDYEPPAEVAGEELSEEEAGDEPPEEVEAAAAAPESGSDAEAEAGELQRRLDGWRYRVATYQYDQMTRRMSELLRSLPDES